MKNPVAILLMTIHLFAYTDIGQVFKFPQLISHYHYHQQKIPDLGFLQFLKMHYTETETNNPLTADNKDDMKLPFKSLEFHIIANALIADEPVITASKAITYISNKFYSFYQVNYPDIFTKGILRPPIVLAA
jgi:hypothetical protein